MSARQQPYVLKHDIVIETRDAAGVEHEDVRRAAGDTIIIKRPKSKDLMIFDSFEGKPMHAIRALLYRTVKLDQLEIDNLDGEDFQALGELVAPDAKSGPTTGEAA